MKAFKSVLIYIVSMMFLLSLTASFEGEKVVGKNLTGLDLSAEQMKLAFYDDFENMDQSEEEDVPQREGEQYAVGNTGDEIYYYQRLLLMSGYLDKEPDGDFDQITKEAVIAYQGANYLEPNGTLDFDTMDRLDLEEAAYTPGQEGEEILQYQEILYYLDYLSEKPQGIFDTATTSALLGYQRDKGLDESGLLDFDTMDSLYLEPITYSQGKEGEPIRELQEKLITMEYLFGVADGDFGSMTRDAVLRFQKDQQLEETGTLDPETINILNHLVEEVSP